MADAFRGLTIRLGADARPLQSAISSIAKSAGVAQQQMNRLNKALKFNPANTQALARMVDLAGDKAAHSARQVQTLKTALNQAANESLKFSERSGLASGKVNELARSTRSVYASTQRLRSESTHITAELQHIYDAAKRAAVASKDLAGVSNWQKADKYVKGLQRNLSRGGASAERATTKLVELFNQVDAKSGVFQKFGIEAGNVDKLKEKFFELRDAFKSAEADLKAMNKVEGFRAIESQLIAAKAELREAAAEAARLKSQLYTFGGSDGIAKAVSDVRRFDSIVDATVADAEAMKQAFKALPHSMSAAQAKTRALANAEDAIRQKLIAVRDAMVKIENTEGFDKMKASSVNAAVAVDKLEREFAELKEKEASTTAGAERLKQIIKEINLLTFDKPKQSVEDLREALKLVGITGKALENPVKTFDKLVAASEKAEKHIKDVNLALDGVEGEMRELGTYKTFQTLNNEAHQLEATLSRINFSKSLFSKLGGVGQTLRQFGYGMYSTLTPALMMVGRYAIQAANDIDASYRDMRKTVNGTEEQFEHLKEAAIEFSRSHVTSADQILEIESIGGQLGITADNLEAFATTVSNLDIATNMDTEDIALQLAKLSNIMHFGQEQYDSFADSLVRLGNNEPALESDIMKISMRFAGMAANVGMGTADMLAFATAATATGQKAEAAGGSMQRTIGRIEKAVAGGAETAKAYAEISGMSAQAFIDTWNDVENHGPARAMQAFIEGLHRVNESGGSVTKTLDGLKISGVRDIQLLEGLSNTTNVLSESLQMSNDAWNGLETQMKDGTIEKAGDAAREAGRKSEGFSGELAKMKNNAAALAVELGEGAAPYIKDLGALFKELTGWFKELPQEMKQFIVGAGGVAAGLGPAFVAVGTFSSAIGHMHGALGSIGRTFTDLGAKLNPIGPSMTKTSKAAGLLGRALTAIGTPKALLAIIAIGAAIGFVSDKAIKEQERLDRLSQSHDKLVDAADNLKFANEKLKSGFDVLLPSVVHTHHELGEFRDGVDQISKKGLELYDTVNSKINGALSDSTLVQLYSDKIRELAGHCGGSKEKLQELKFAIEKYNEMTGDSIEITDNFSGAINASTAELEANTRAFQANQIAKAYESVLADAQAHLAEVNVEIVKNKNAIQDATDELAEHGITLDEAVEAMNNLELHPEQAAQLDYKFGGTGWRDLEGTVMECSGAIVNLGEEQQAAQKLVNAGMESYIAATKEATIAANEAAEETKKVGKAKTYYDELGEGGAKAFRKIREEVGYAYEDRNKFAQALNEADISPDLLKNVGTEAFSGFYEQAQKLSDEVPKQLSYVEDAMRAVDNYDISPKEITVTDDGAITEFEGKIVNFNKMTFDGKEFEVTSDGSLEFTEGQTVMLEKSLKRLERKFEPKVEADDNATPKINNVYEAGMKVDGKHWTTYIDIHETKYEHTVKDKTATGAIFNGRKIPLNASGAINGIVNRAMLTNIGWVGEAGAEAVMHMKNAGGAVIPLSNRRYVRPFARAVASEMGGTSTQVVNKYYSVGNVSFPEGSDGARALEALYNALRLEEAV